MSMKKLYSKIALALLAAGISFTASALDVATSMTEWTLEPVDGAEVEMLDVIYVQMEWSAVSYRRMPETISL